MGVLIAQATLKRIAVRCTSVHMIREIVIIIIICTISNNPINTIIFSYNGTVHVFSIIVAVVSIDRYTCTCTYLLIK